jgi:hypothetical protein
MSPVQLNSLIVAAASAAIAAGGAVQTVVPLSLATASPASARVKLTKHGALDSAPLIRTS